MNIIIFQLVILIFSAIIHEIAHGVTAERLGDPTAKLMGRLTFNPLRHLDFFGSFLLPVTLYLFTGGSFVFGYAKPVPYNPANLKRPIRDGGLIASAGPISNMVIAIAFSVLYRISLSPFVDFPLLAMAAPLFGYIVLINLSLAIFNLVPLPPLDGSKILFALLPRKADKFAMFLEQYGSIVFLLFLFFGIHLISPIILSLFNILIG